MTTKNVVFVVLYRHDHGTDSWVCSTEQKAWISIGETIKNYFNELTDDAVEKKIRKLLNAKDFQKASALWSDHTTEWFEIHPNQVDSHGR